MSKVPSRHVLAFTSFLVALLLLLALVALGGCGRKKLSLGSATKGVSTYEAVYATDFDDPNTSEVYPIIDGRVIIQCNNAPIWPTLGANDFDDPEADLSEYWDDLDVVIVASQETNAPPLWPSTSAEEIYAPEDDYEINQFLVAEEVEVISYWPAIRSLLVTLPEGMTVEEAMDEWPTEYTDLIDSVWPDACAHYCTDPNDEDYPSSRSPIGQWHLRTTTFPVLAVSILNKTFTIGAQGQDNSRWFPAGSKFDIENSTGNDAQWTVSSVTYGNSFTTITVTSSPANSTPDGSVVPKDCSLHMDQVWPGYYVANEPGHPSAICIMDTGVDWPNNGMLAYGHTDLADNSTLKGCNVGPDFKASRFLTRTTDSNSAPYGYGNGRPSKPQLQSSVNDAEALGHGTGVAGITSATINNDTASTPDSKDVAGVAPVQDCYPIAMDATTASDTNHPDNMPYRSGFINALFAAACTKGIVGDPSKYYPSGVVPPRYNVEAINMSFYWDTENTNEWIERNMLDVLSQYIVLVCGAGNDHNTISHFPASHSQTISVGGTDYNGDLWVNPNFPTTKGSNYASTVDIAAPSVDLWTTDLVGYSGDDHTSGYALGYAQGTEADLYLHGFSLSPGTSLAAPQVTAVAAMLADMDPDLEPADIVTRILDGSTEPLTSDQGSYPASLYSHIKRFDAYATLFP
jgi:hypothetical protein